MSRALEEHDYCTGLSSSSSSSENDDSKASSSFKETELRLGLPGTGTGRSSSSSSAAGSGVSLSLFGKDLLKNHQHLVSGAKRGFSDTIHLSVSASLDPPTKDAAPSNHVHHNPAASPTNQLPTPPASKAQVVGWPPIRSFRKNTMASNLTKNNDEAEGKTGLGCVYVKVSMDGAPYLRKVDLKTYTNYGDLSSALENMFTCFTIGHCNSPGLPGKDGLSESSLRDLLHGSEYVLTYEDKDGDWMLVGDVPWEMFIDSCKRLRIMKGSEAIGLAPRTVEKSRSQN